MSLSVQLSVMRTAVRQRANIESETPFIPDIEINGYLNYWLNEIYDALIDARGQRYYRSANIFSTVSGTDTYALPADFYQLESVDLTLSGGPSNVKVPMRPYNEEERDDYVAYPAFTPTTGAPLQYSLQGNNIRFIPMPAGVYTITLNYVPAFAPLTLDTSTFDGVSGWEEAAIWGAAADCLNKEDPSDNAIAFAMGQAQRIMARIQRLKKSRDSNEPERVHDVKRNILARWAIR